MVAMGAKAAGEAMKSWHIVRVCEQFPPAPGGLAPGMVALANAQQAHGHQLTVITRAAPNSEQVDQTLPYRVIRLPAASLLHLGWQAQAVIRRLPIAPDVIHGHGPAIVPLLLHRGRWPTRAPIVVTLHTVRRYQFSLFRQLAETQRLVEGALGRPVRQPPPNYAPWSWRVQREWLWERIICRRADHLALVAAYLGPQIMAHYGVEGDRWTPIYNGSIFEPTAAGAAGFKPVPAMGGEGVMMYVGRLDWFKRVHLLVLAWPQVRQTCPTARLIVVGKGEQATDLRDLVTALGLEESVTFIDWLDHAQLATLYRQAAGVCLPSVSEGLSKVLLEAMSVGTPVLASDIPANRELLADGRYGYLTPAATPAAWAEAMLAVLSEPTTAQAQARAAQAVVEERYRWSHVAGRLDEVYRQVLRPAGGD